jgi:amino acid transporter
MYRANTTTLLVYLGIMAIASLWAADGAATYDHTALGTTLFAIVIFVLALLAHVIVILPYAVLFLFYKATRSGEEDVPNWLNIILFVITAILFFKCVDYMHTHSWLKACEDFVLGITY